MVKYQYQQGDRVYFNLDGKIKGWAKICGSATSEMPVIGRTWIIEPEEPTPFNKVIYPFTHITAFSCQLDVEEFDVGKSTWNKTHKEKDELPLNGGEDYTSPQS